MNIEDLRDVLPGQVISAHFINALKKAVVQQGKLSVESPLVMMGGPGGPCIALGIEVNPFSIRIAANYGGPGVYKAFVITPSLGSLLDAVDTNSEIKLGDADADQPDDEEIVVWNAAERGTGGHSIPVDTIIPCPGGGVFLGTITIAGGSEKRRLLLIDHGGAQGNEVVYINSGSTGKNCFRGYVCTVQPPYEWVPVLDDDDNDTTTTYTSGAAFANGDYAKNLSDGIVYHRESGAWVNAAGHLTTSDIDDEEDFDYTRAQTFYVLGAEEVIILCNGGVGLYSDDNPLYQDNISYPAFVGDYCSAIYKTTRSDGVKVYVIDGIFRIAAGPTDTPHVVMSWNAGNVWVQDYLRPHG